MFGDKKNLGENSVCREILRSSGSRLLMRTSTCTRRTSSARELGRGACDLASTGSSVHRYYDPVTAQFVSVDPLVQSTGQPYTYAGSDPVNGVDPAGLCPWGLGWACNVGNFLTDHSRWRAEANYLAGVGNGLTLDQLHLSEPYCNSLDWTYGVGSGFGFAITVVGAATGAEALFGGAANGSIAVEARPPGYDATTWEYRASSRLSNPENSYWDPQGGEWRYHPEDPWHNAHGDYNPWDTYNSPWQHTDRGG